MALKQQLVDGEHERRMQEWRARESAQQRAADSVVRTIEAEHRSQLIGPGGLGGVERRVVEERRAAVKKIERELAALRAQAAEYGAGRVVLDGLGGEDGGGRGPSLNAFAPHGVGATAAGWNWQHGGSGGPPAAAWTGHYA